MSTTTITTIRYLVGDATRPIGDGPRIIAHVCNDVGLWGAGFSGALSRRWSETVMNYKSWFRGFPTSAGTIESNRSFVLGAIQLVPVEPGLTVCNMVAQRDIKPDQNGQPPIRYWAVSRGLELLRVHIQRSGLPDVSVHMPRIGCGLAGGKWSSVEPRIEEELCRHGIAVTVYDLPTKPYRERPASPAVEEVPHD